MTVVDANPDLILPESQPTATGRTANTRAIGLVLLSVAFGAVGQLVLKAGMNSLGKLQFSPEALLAMATSPLLLVGITIFCVSTLLWLLALSRADLSFAYPFLSLTYIAVLIGGAVLFHEQITVDRVLGFLIIVAGVWIVARSEKA